MSCKAIQLKGLGKLYHLGVFNRQTLTEEVQYWWHRVRGRNPKMHMGKVSYDTRAMEARSVKAETSFWALKDVSFDIHAGEVVGIIGGNGAGKSTLLKLLSRITDPSEGEAIIHGRVGSLLEVGTGFHPELTGRENVYMNGTILGMKRGEIDRKFDEIVSFADIEKFLDTPVKRYSSGMYVKLAFAVAAHLEPEILMVDEVLAVGDIAFQKKCLEKMGTVGRDGRTVLFVSHNMSAIQGMCDRVIWLHSGQVRKDGPCEEVIGEYLKSSNSQFSERCWNDMESAPGNDKVRLKRACVRPRDSITVRTPLEIEIDLWNREADVVLNLSLQVINEFGVVAFVTMSLSDTRWLGKPFPKGLFRFVCHIPGDLLNNGQYRVAVLVDRDNGDVIWRFADLLAFDVHDSADLRGGWYGKWAGALRPKLEWMVEQIDS